MRNSGNVQGRIGRAARGRHRRTGIFQTLAGDQITRQWSALRNGLHDLFASAARQGQSLAIDGRNHR